MTAIILDPVNRKLIPIRVPGETAADKHQWIYPLGDNEIYTKLYELSPVPGTLLPTITMIAFPHVFEDCGREEDN